MGEGTSGRTLRKGQAQVESSLQVDSQAAPCAVIRTRSELALPHPLFYAPSPSLAAALAAFRQNQDLHLDFGERNILAADFEMAVEHERVLRRSDAARGARPDQVHLSVRKLSGLNHRCGEAAEECGWVVEKLGLFFKLNLL